MRAYGTPHALIFPIYDWSLTHIERSFFAALLKERGRRQLTGCFRPFLTCAKRRACGFSAGPSTLMRKIGFLLSFCGGVFWPQGFFRQSRSRNAQGSGIRKDWAPFSASVTIPASKVRVMLPSSSSRVNGVLASMVT